MKNNQDTSAQDPIADEGDETTSYYLARFEAQAGSLSLRTNGEQPVTFSGEIVISARTTDKGIIVDGFRRISLWTESEHLNGLLSLAGPADEWKMEPGGKGVLAPFTVRIYYPLLSEEKPCGEDSDALYPQLETLEGQLPWSIEEANDEEISMNFEFVLDKFTDGPLGMIERASFDPAILVFHLMKRSATGFPSHRSLITCTSAGPVSIPGDSHEHRSLNLRFVSISTVITNIAILEGIAQPLINAACEVWWAKAGVRINPQPAIVLATFGNGIVSAAQESSLGSVSGVTNAVEVYLVDQLTARPGGGWTMNCGTSGAYVILEIGKAQNNKYLLAHELGHVLGLTHPDTAPSTSTTCKSYVRGSSCSVMVPHSPNSKRNTNNNMTVLDSSAMPLGPVLVALGYLGSWNPDPPQGFFHTIRDFPYDDGTEPSVPQPPASNWWSYSDVWNSSKAPSVVSGFQPTAYADNTPMFATDYSPMPSNPVRAGATNYMYVRVHTCENLTSPVNVYLYLANPGAASAPLVPLNGNNPLVFSSSDGSMPTPGTPKTRQITWNVPTGYPTHCCVFAVARSANEGTPTIVNQVIANPGAHHFSDLASSVALDNDIAQRNLNVQNVPTPSGGRGLMTTLPWVGFSNPGGKEGKAVLEIDITQAPALAGLAVEVDEGKIADVDPGGRESIILADSLLPGIEMVVRFRASVPVGVQKGKFPIHIRFLVGDEMISGYTHVIQPSSLAEATTQVLDSLYGALRDVGESCRSTGAMALASRIERIIQMERLGLRPPMGCLGVLWILFGGKPLSWRFELFLLSREFREMGIALAADERQECQKISHWVTELSTLLSDLKASNTPFILEEIRDRADRIQKLAGDMLR